MSNRSAIEWTDATWNPIVGCSIVSPGCTNCYAMKEAYRFGFNPNLQRYHGLTKMVNGNAIWTGKLAMAPDSSLLAPLHRKKPTKYFVNSMGDLFHEDCPDEWIDKVFAVMALAPQHTFQVLTKRAGRMREYCSGFEIERLRWIADQTIAIPNFMDVRCSNVWPLLNVWLGVSTERQQEADERIPLLLQTPAAKRFISAEPLLGPIEARPWLGGEMGCESCDDGHPGSPRCHRNDIPREQQCPEKFCVFDTEEGPLDEDGAPGWINQTLIKLDWVIVGGESGPHARPMSIQWVRELRDQCASAGVSFFFKQWGEWRPAGVHQAGYPGRFAFGDYEYDRATMVQVDGYPRQFTTFGSRSTVERVGKKAAGRLLDGVEHNGFPTQGEWN